MEPSSIDRSRISMTQEQTSNCRPRPFPEIEVLRLAVVVRLLAAVAAFAVATPTGVSAISEHDGVATRTETFVDTSRRTQPNPASGQRGSDRRMLRTTIWFPRARVGPFPLVVFAHGAGSRPERHESMLRRWAESGYVVAAPAFPVSSRRSPGRAADLDLPQ